MDSSSAVSVLQETRQHAAQVAGHAADFRTKLEAFEHTVETRFSELQHAHQELIAHIQSERDRARAENDALAHLLQEATEWLHQSGTVLQTDTKALSDELASAEHGSDTATTALQQAVDHLAQLTSTTNEHLGTFGTQTQAEVEHAHEQAHEQFLSTLGTTQQSLHGAASQHEAAVNAAFHTDFHGHHEEFHAQTESVATQAVHLLHDRATRLHADIAHEVDNLHQHQDQHHQDLLHKLESVKQDLNHLGSLVTDTAHGLADGVDSASMLAQTTNIGVQEVLKIIQNIESIFQDIIGSMNS